MYSAICQICGNKFTARAKASGHYNEHIQKHLNSVNYKSTLSDDYVDSSNAIMDGYK